MYTKIQEAILNLLDWAAVAFITLMAMFFTLGALTIAIFALINGVELMDFVGVVGCLGAAYFCWSIWR